MLPEESLVVNCHVGSERCRPVAGLHRRRRLMSPEPRLETSLWSAEPGEVRDVTVGQTLHHAAETVPERVALVDCVEDPARRRQWTYAEFVAEAERAARALLTQFQPGDRIAVWAPNSAE